MSQSAFLVVLALLQDPSNFAPCKGENEKQRIASVRRGCAGGDGVMKSMVVMQVFQKAIDVPHEHREHP